MTLLDWWRNKRTPIYEASTANGWLRFFLEFGSVMKGHSNLPEDSKIVPLVRCRSCEKTLIRSQNEVCARCAPPDGSHVIAGKIIRCTKAHCSICERPRKVLSLKRGAK